MAKKSTLTLKTPLKDELAISLLQGHETLGRLFQYELELFSHNEEINIDDILGQNVTAHFDDGTGGVRYFNGIVSTFSQTGQLEDGGASYHATLRPWLWFLTRTADCRIFQNMSVPDIIKQVFQDQGFSDIQDELREEHKTWDYCVQYRETDFNFVSRLMEEEGIYYFFIHEDGKHTLVLADSGSAHQAIRDADVMYYPVASANLRKEQCVSSWLIRREVQPGAYALNDYDFRRPNASLRVREQIPKKHAGSEYEIYDYPGEYADRFEGSNGEYAELRIQELHVQQDQVEGVTDLRIMATGGLFKLDMHPRKDQNKEYLVIDAACEISHYGGSDGGAGMVFQCQFTAIDSQVPFRPARVTPKPVVQGPQTAVVVGPSGEQIAPDEHGRVKVQFHWDREGGNDENSSCWVRVSQIWAGNGWGGMFVPHIGHEVIVEFLEGDPDRPIITGRVYNGDNKPPQELPANKTKSIIHDFGDNEIILEGEDGAQFIHIQQSCGNKILVDGAGGEEKITLIDKSGNEIKIDAVQGSIRFFAPENNTSFEMGKCSTGKMGFDKKTDGDWHEHTSGNKVKTMVGTEESFNLSAKLEMTAGVTTSTFVGLKHETLVGGKVGFNAAKEYDKNLLKVQRKSKDEIKYDSEKKIWLIGGPGDEAQLILDANGAQLFSKTAKVVIYDNGGIQVQGKKNVAIKSDKIIKIGTKSHFKGDGSLVEIKTTLKHPNLTASK